MHTAPAWDLSVDFGGDEFVVTDESPRISWKLPRDMETQTTAEIAFEVDGEQGASATIESAKHLFLDWPGPVLASRQQVRWRVRVADSRGWRDWSEWCEFEVGILPQDWTGFWISPPEPEDPGPGHRPAYELSCEFDVKLGLQRARLYATAFGVYEAWIGETRQGSAQLTPGSTSYEDTLYAQAFDIAPSLREGENQVRLVVSDGWFRGQVGAFRVPSGWGDRIAARAVIYLDYEDGSTDVIQTDSKWQARLTDITRADLMEGQWDDFSVEAASFEPVLLNQAEGPTPTWSPAPPVRIVEELSPVGVQSVDANTWVVDFGQNASGWIRLTDLGTAGTETVIDYGEHVTPEGDLTTAHLDSERPDQNRKVFVQQDRVVSDGTDKVFEPHHTIHGFQYARIRRDRGEFSPQSAKMCVVHTDFARAGEFQCSNRDFNSLFRIADWSFRSNAVDVPTDCPTRERQPWTGDYQVFAPTSTRLYDVLGFARKWLKSVRDDQFDDGRIPNFAPDGRRLKHNLQDQMAHMTGSSGWGDAIVLVPWEMYRAYGDKGVLEENWDAMRRWVGWVSSKAETERHFSRQQRSEAPLPHEKFIWDGTFHWGEWLEPKEKRPDGTPIDPLKENPAQWFMADKGEVGTAYFYRSTSVLSEIALLLGHQDESERYGDLANNILEAWRLEFLTLEGRTVADTQASYVRALAFGLLPEDLRPTAAKRLVELINTAGGHLKTGFLSTGLLLPVLADNGYAEVAYEVLQQRTPPSWLYMLDQGATTVWEEWEGIDEAGNAHESLNHYSKGAAILFFFTHVLGLRQSSGSAAWERFEVRPVPNEAVSWAWGSHQSPMGPIDVYWHLEDGEMEISVDVPAGSSAMIHFPDGHVAPAGPGQTRVSRNIG